MEKTLKKNVNIILTDYKYESCNKFFFIPQMLKKHINSVHNGQKDHKCDCCGKSFAERGKLKVHINSVQTTTVIHATNYFLYHRT